MAEVCRGAPNSGHAAEAEDTPTPEETRRRRRLSWQIHMFSLDAPSIMKPIVFLHGFNGPQRRTCLSGPRPSFTMASNAVQAAARQIQQQQAAFVKRLQLLQTNHENLQKTVSQLVSHLNPEWEKPADAGFKADVDLPKNAGKCSNFTRKSCFNWFNFY